MEGETGRRKHVPENSDQPPKSTIYFTIIFLSKKNAINGGIHTVYRFIPNFSPKIGERLGFMR
jgi:hypothetical protein